MLVKTYGSAVYGVNALTITIEVNISAGKQCVNRFKNSVYNKYIVSPQQIICLIQLKLFTVYYYV
jgi:hypothetical protein